MKKTKIRVFIKSRKKTQPSSYKCLICKYCIHCGDSFFCDACDPFKPPCSLYQSEGVSK